MQLHVAFKLVLSADRVSLRVLGAYLLVSKPPDAIASSAEKPLKMGISVVKLYGLINPNLSLEAIISSLISTP